MNKLSVLLLAATWVSNVNASPLRGSALQLQEQDIGQSNRSRHALQGSTCTLFKQMTEYEGYHDESWACELSEEDSTRLNVQFVSIVSSPAVATIANAASGESVLIMSEAIVDTDTAEMYVPEGAHVEVRNISRNRSRALTTLPSTTGTLKVLVIRVTDKNKKSPEADDDQLIDDIFKDSSSLATQILACSYGELKIEPFVGKSPRTELSTSTLIHIIAIKACF